MVDDKFNNNRNKFRRVYSVGGRPPPNLQSYEDRFTGETRIRDFNQILRDRDYYLINVMQSQSAPPSPFGEYAEELLDLYTIDGAVQDTFLYSFPITFSSPPIITIEIPSGSGAGFVNPYLGLVTTTFFVFALSAPSTGTIVYKAVNAASYPVQVLRAPRFPSTTTICAADFINVLSVQNVTMSFAPVALVPPSEFSSTFIHQGNLEADVYIDRTQLATNAATAELSQFFYPADGAGRINFIALK